MSNRVSVPYMEAQLALILKCVHRARQAEGSSKNVHLSTQLRCIEDEVERLQHHIGRGRSLSSGLPGVPVFDLVFDKDGNPSMQEFAQGKWVPAEIAIPALRKANANG